MPNTPLEMLRHHVSGAIERGDKEAIVEMREKHGDQEYTETERTMRIYRIVRVYKNDRQSRTTRSGLTLQEAQQHCARKDTSTATYMDTYTTMRGVSVK